MSFDISQHKQLRNQQTTSSFEAHASTLIWLRQILQALRPELIARMLTLSNQQSYRTRSRSFTTKDFVTGYTRLTRAHFLQHHSLQHAVLAEKLSIGTLHQVTTNLSLHFPPRHDYSTAPVSTWPIAGRVLVHSIIQWPHVRP